MVGSTLRSQRITQNVMGADGGFQNLLSFLTFDIFHLSDLAIELNPGSQYYEDSDAEVMVPISPVVARKWQRENWKLAAMVRGNFSKRSIIMRMFHVASEIEKYVFWHPRMQRE